MAGIRGLVEGSADNPAVLSKAIPGLLTTSPLVAEFMTGVPALGSNPAIPKHYFSFFLETDGLVCRISCKDGKEAIYTKITDPVTPWLCLERNLQEGNFTRRKVTAQTPY